MADAMIAAVSRHRDNGEETTRWTPPLAASSDATARASWRPCSIKGGSPVPEKRFSIVNAVTPWRTSNNVVGGAPVVQPTIRFGVATASGHCRRTSRLQPEWLTGAFVHRAIRQPVGVLVAFARYPGKGDVPVTERGSQ